MLRRTGEAHAARQRSEASKYTTMQSTRKAEKASAGSNLRLTGRMYTIDLGGSVCIALGGIAAAAAAYLESEEVSAACAVVSGKWQAVHAAAASYHLII